MPERNPLENFGFIDKTIPPSKDKIRDEELEKSQQLNNLKKELEELLQKGPERGNEIDFENKLTDLQNMIEKLEH